MLVSKLFSVALAVQTAAAYGWSTYREILEGTNNADEISYWELDRSNIIWLYIQIRVGGDHASLIKDFKTLVNNYRNKGVSLIPRVRYGDANGEVIAEPNDSALILKDVAQWAGIFTEVSSLIDIPLIQAGFLGLWGEWHSGPFCKEHGIRDSKRNLEVKKQIVEALQKTGKKIAIRYPADHKALFPGSRAVTIHNDCIFNGGPKGYDGGTFPDEDRQTWVDYTKQVASGNFYGGEGCNQASDSTYNWSNWTDVCGSNGLVKYINEFQISYMNPGNPPEMDKLFNDRNQKACTDAIGAALKKYN